MNTRFLRIAAACSVVFAATLAPADDWGHYAIVPVSAPTLVLEVVDSGTTAGTGVSIGWPGDQHLQWYVRPLAGSPIPAVAVMDEASTYVPPVLKPEDILPGEIKQCQFIATRSGVQISADDGPTQVILPVPDNSRVTGVCLGGQDGDTLFAFVATKSGNEKSNITPWERSHHG